jgi:hypothetical protein
MVALEAWALGKPVLANGRCDVLKGQCIRSGAGLYYESYEEFAETLYSLESNGPLNARLGRNGREYFTRHYAWPVIERKYLATFERLQREPAPRAPDPLPGWFARRRRNLPAAADVLARLPSGPVVAAIRAEPAAVPEEDRRAADRRPERRRQDDHRYRGRHDRRGTRRT